MSNLSSLYLATYIWALFCGGAANILLGLSSLYWRELSAFPPLTLIASRILLSLIILCLIAFWTNKTQEFKKLNIEMLGLHFGASILLTINWGAFIWASINGHILESGFGYLLAPFLSIGIGVIIYKETLRITQTLSIIIISVSAVLLILYDSKLNHWVYSAIAISWGLYTCAKKANSLDPINGLLIETLILSAGILSAWIIFDWSLAWPENTTYRFKWLIFFAGCISVFPLAMFSYAVKRLPLATTGFLQFTLPITQLFVAMFFYKQPIPIGSLSLFVVTLGILISLFFYECAGTRSRKRNSAK
ncbi:MAG: EamA family transporter [Pseudomonas proteolytica]|uniref:EamA family transporter n=1 Tax=Pseudomonas proteolytica TaxID=219574 RepID=UPI003F392FCF